MSKDVIFCHIMFSFFSPPFTMLRSNHLVEPVFADLDNPQPSPTISSMFLKMCHVFVTLC